MLDINYIREHTEEVRKNLARRKNEAYISLLDQVIAVDKDWRKIKGEIDELRARRNKISAEINEARKAGKDISKLVKEAAETPKLIAEKEQKLIAHEQNIRNCLLQIPNLMHESVPYGKDDTENVPIKFVGKKPEFKFTPISHVDIVVENDWADLERAAKISGARWYFLKGELAQLELAITNYAIDFMREKGFTLVIPPFMMGQKPYEGVTSLGDFEEALYKIEGEDLHPIATSEHPLTAQYMDETFDARKLPIKLVGYSTCFRKEAGAHGKDQRGIFRVHQFNKVEQIVLCTPEQSWKFHEQMVKHAMDFFESLGIHFRIVNICTGDLGIVAAKKYDLEGWFPVQNTYRELVSGSNCTEYQSRRLNIKYAKGQKKELIHTLNCTCVATSSALVAIIENFQSAAQVCGF